MFDIFFILLTPITVGFLFGFWLDSKLGFKFPVCALLLAMLGFFFGMYSVYRRYIK
jgi:F0F1-type ATP synthase assembly protein I